MERNIQPSNETVVSDCTVYCFIIVLHFRQAVTEINFPSSHIKHTEKKKTASRVLHFNQDL